MGKSQELYYCTEKFEWSMMEKITIQSIKIKHNYKFSAKDGIVNIAHLKIAFDYI